MRESITGVPCREKHSNQVEISIDCSADPRTIAEVGSAGDDH